MRKKIATLCLICALAITAVAGVSLAYFTDTDTATNVFTSGKVDITLNEEFDEESAQLIPGIEIQKDVTISLSDDSVESYVWYTYAVPAVLDSNEAGKKIIHISHAAGNCLETRNDESYWTADQTEAIPENQCWIVNSSCEENVKIDGVLYNVYTCLYNGTLTAGQETSLGMTKVYLDTKVDFDNENGNYTIDGEAIDFDLNDVKIIVTAYGIQAATFDNVQAAYAAYTAQNTVAAEVGFDID